MLSLAARPSIHSGESWVERLSRAKTRYVGIDVGIDQVKISTLGWKKDPTGVSHSTPSLIWRSHGAFPLPVDPHSPPPPDWVDLLIDQLSDRLPRCIDGDRNATMISLPLPWLHYQTTPNDDIPDAWQQCNAMFESSLFQSRSHLRHWPVAQGGQQSMIAATAESAARRIAESIAGVGYLVQGVLPHGAALLHAAPTLTSLRPSAVVLLELSGGLVAVREQQECGLCRTLPSCNIAIGEQPFADELDPWLQEIASEVDATLRYAARLGASVDWDSPLLLCGSAALIEGVDTALATMIGRSVATWQYAGRNRPGNRSGSESILSDRAKDAGLAVSLSLACCGIRVVASGTED